MTDNSSQYDHAIRIQVDSADATIIGCRRCLAATGKLQWATTVFHYVLFISESRILHFATPLSLTNSEGTLFCFRHIGLNFHHLNQRRSRTARYPSFYCVLSKVAKVQGAGGPPRWFKLVLRTLVFFIVLQSKAVGHQWRSFDNILFEIKSTTRTPPAKQ